MGESPSMPETVESPDPEHDTLVFEVVTYRRHVGTAEEDVRPYAHLRESVPHSTEEDRRALERLEAGGRVARVGERWFLSPPFRDAARGPAFPPEWRQEDSWILLSLLLVRHHAGPATLADIVAAADAISHAIPTLEEVHGALNRLNTAGLVRARTDGFHVTQRALDLEAKAEATCPRRLLDQWECLRRLLDCPCCGIRLRAVRWRIDVTVAELDQAGQQYHAWFQQARLRRKPRIPSQMDAQIPTRRKGGRQG